MEANLLAWSTQRSRSLGLCSKQYYYRYVVYGGWKKDAPDLHRQIHHLRYLTTEAMYVGTIVHRAIRKILESCLQGTEWNPDLEIAVARGKFATVAKYGFGLTLHQLKKDRPKFLSQHLGRELTADQIVIYQTEIEDLLRNFLRTDAFVRLRANPERILPQFLDPDSPLLTQIAGVPAYLKTDLIEQFYEGIMVYDWKTGSPHPDHREQGLLYDIFARAIWPSTAVSVRNVYLSENHVEEWTYTEDEREEALWRIREQFGDFRHLSDDAVYNVAPPGRFLERVGYHCQHCPFQTICAPFQKSKGGRP